MIVGGAGWGRVARRAKPEARGTVGAPFQFRRLLRGEEVGMTEVASQQSGGVFDALVGGKVLREVAPVVPEDKREPRTLPQLDRSA